MTAAIAVVALLASVVGLIGVRNILREARGERRQLQRPPWWMPNDEPVRDRYAEEIDLLRNISEIRANDMEVMDRAHAMRVREADFQRRHRRPPAAERHHVLNPRNAELDPLAWLAQQPQPRALPKGDEK